MKIHSITQRLVLSLIVTVVFVSATVIMSLYFVMVSGEAKDLFEKAEDYQAGLVGSLELPLWNYDQETVRRIGETFSQNNIVVNLMIKNHSGITIYNMEKGHDADLISRTDSIYHRGKYLGKIEFSLTKQYIKETGRKLLSFHAIAMVFVLMSILVVASVLVRRFLKKPLNDLDGIVRGYAEGNYDVKADGLPYLEFRSFGSVLDKMAEAIKEHQAHLEEVVKDRTAELEAERNRAQQYLDIAGVILVAIDSERRVTLINQKGCEVLQGTSAEIIGRDWFETFIPDNIRHNVIEGYRQLIARELEPMEYFEYPVLTKSGRERLVAWHNALLRDSNDQIMGTLSSGEDITEKRHTEEQIIKLNQDLEKRAAALEAANRELEGFSYSVSHDLRAPLRHIDGFLDLLQEKVGTIIDKEGRHYMDTISDAAQKMGQLVDDLLSFARMGHHTVTFQRVEMGILVREVISELESGTDAMNIEWHIGDLPAVEGDATMLRIVIGNLIDNAMKFTRSREKARIEIGSLPGQNAEAVVFVRDNGVGFDMAYSKKLFGVFQRLHRQEDFKGTGIGLANVQRILDRHGGRIWADGKVDQGASFFFSLPQTLP